MNSFKFFRLKRKLTILCHVDDYFELHSRATEGGKDKNGMQKGSRGFGILQLKKLNKFYA
jgi:hypothetical protein